MPLLRAAAAFRGSGFDAALGVAGGFLDMPTGSPSLMGGAGELVGEAARIKLEIMKYGAPYNTRQQVAQLNHFTRTGQQAGEATGRVAAAAATGTPAN